MTQRPSTPLRRIYAMWAVIGILLAGLSLATNPNGLAFCAGLILGGAVVALDREVKRG